MSLAEQRETLPDTRRFPTPVKVETIRRMASTRPFLTFMLLVSALAALYYGLVASPLYVSETRFSIRSKEVAAPTGLFASLVGAPSGISDISAVYDYIRSPEMMQTLEKRHQLRELYSRFRIDPFQWLSRGASEEKFLNFYRKHVVVKLDREANTVIVEVRSFTPDSAQAVAISVLDLTETFVNNMSKRLRDETLRSATVELALAQKQADQARQEVQRFRGAASDLDPMSTGAQVVGGVGALEGQIAEARAEMASLLTYSRPDAPQVRQVQARINALNGQIARLKAQQGGGGGALSKTVTDFETLQMNRANAEKKLAAALTAYDQARTTAEQREKYVVRIVTPQKPQTPTMPKRFLEFLTVLIFAMAGYALVSLSIAAIRDHKGV